MKKTVLLITVAFMSLTANAQKATKLFNGKNLKGWTLFTKEINDIASEEYVVKGGCIDLSGKFGYIYTNKTYSNYKLTLKWRWVGEGTNSGVFLNMQGLNMTWPSCYEAQLCSGIAGDIIHSNGATSNEFFKNGKKNITAASERNIENEIGEWNQMEVVVSNNTIVVTVNGKKVNEIHNLSNKEGHIGLQSEGKGIQFKDVMIEELSK